MKCVEKGKEKIQKKGRQFFLKSLRVLVFASFLMRNMNLRKNPVNKATPCDQRLFPREANFFVPHE